MKTLKEVNNSVENSVWNSLRDPLRIFVFRELKELKNENNW